MHSTQTQKEIAIRDTEKKERKNREKGATVSQRQKGEAAIGNRKALEVKWAKGKDYVRAGGARR